MRRVELTQPLQWLHRGYTDLRLLGGPSLACGAFIAASGAILLTLVWGAAYLVPAVIVGWVVVTDPLRSFGPHRSRRSRHSSQPFCFRAAATWHSPDLARVVRGLCGAAAGCSQRLRATTARACAIDWVFHWAHIVRPSFATEAEVRR